MTENWSETELVAVQQSNWPHEPVCPLQFYISRYKKCWRFYILEGEKKKSWARQMQGSLLWQITVCWFHESEEWKDTGNVKELIQNEKGAKRQRKKKRRAMPLRLRLAKGEGRRHRAVQYWRISEAGIDVFPGTAEFMHYHELKKPLLWRHLCYVGGWINTLGVLPFFSYSLSWGWRCDSNLCY